MYFFYIDVAKRLKILKKIRKNNKTLKVMI